MELTWAPSASAEYDRLPLWVRERIDEAIYKLATARTGDVKLLRGTGEPEYRLRVGEHRVCFSLLSGWDQVLVLSVRKRDTAYRGLAREDVAAYPAAAVGEAGA